MGFDNLLYISIESKRAPESQQASVRRNGILIAIGLRIVLLYVMVKLIEVLTEPFFSVHWTGVIEGSFNFSTIVFLFGGVFIMYTAVKEIGHMLAVENLHAEGEGKSGKSAAQVIALIVFMNLILFVRLDSIRAGHHRCVPSPGSGHSPVRSGYAASRRPRFHVPGEESEI